MASSEPPAGELARDGRTDGVGFYLGREGPPVEPRRTDKEIETDGTTDKDGNSALPGTRQDP
jgi:hypothetical protein